MIHERFKLFLAQNFVFKTFNQVKEIRKLAYGSANERKAYSCKEANEARSKNFLIPRNKLVYSKPQEE